MLFLTSVLPVLCQNISYGKDKKSVLRSCICLVQSQRAPPERRTRSAYWRTCLLLALICWKLAAAVCYTANLETLVIAAMCSCILLACMYEVHLQQELANTNIRESGL